MEEGEGLVSRLSSARSPPPTWFYACALDTEHVNLANCHVQTTMMNLWAARAIADHISLDICGRVAAKTESTGQLMTAAFLSLSVLYCLICGAR